MSDSKRLLETYEKNRAQAWARHKQTQSEAFGVGGRNRNKGRIQAVAANPRAMWNGSGFVGAPPATNYDPRASNAMVARTGNGGGGNGNTAPINPTHRPAYPVPTNGGGSNPPGSYPTHHPEGGGHPQGWPPEHPPPYPIPPGAHPWWFYPPKNDCADPMHGCDTPQPCGWSSIGGNTLGTPGIAPGQTLAIPISAGDASTFKPKMLYFEALPFATPDLIDMSRLPPSRETAPVLLVDAMVGRNSQLRRGGSPEVGQTQGGYANSKPLVLLDWKEFTSTNEHTLKVYLYNPNQDLPIHAFVDLWGEDAGF